MKQKKPDEASLGQRIRFEKPASEDLIRALDFSEEISDLEERKQYQKKREILISGSRVSKVLMVERLLRAEIFLGRIEKHLVQSGEGSEDYTDLSREHRQTIVFLSRESDSKGKLKVRIEETTTSY